MLGLPGEVSFFPYRVCIDWVDSFTSKRIILNAKIKKQDIFFNKVTSEKDNLLHQ